MRVGISVFRNGSPAIDARVIFPFRIKRLSQLLALVLMTGVVVETAIAGHAFSSAGFSRGVAQHTATSMGRFPDGLPASLVNGAYPLVNRGGVRVNGAHPLVPHSWIRVNGAHPLTHLNTAAQAIAMQQRLQQQAREAALLRPSSIPDGLGSGGLKIDEDALTRGWHNAKDPTQTVTGGKTMVTIEQTGDKAILNWETFNVGKNTTVDFKQNTDWAVLNRVNDPLSRPSEIQGQIKGAGTVMLINRNGVLFSGSSQVNVRNLAASAVNMSDAQFGQGIYSQAQGSVSIPTFANNLKSSANSFSYGAATGSVIVERGASLQTHKPTSVTEGGYVLLLGKEVHNAGTIVTANGQTTLAAGDAFVIKKGLGTEENQTSTARDHVVTALRNRLGRSENGKVVLPNLAGRVFNTGLIQAAEGAIDLIGARGVQQDGVITLTKTPPSELRQRPDLATTDTCERVWALRERVAAYYCL